MGLFDLFKKKRKKEYILCAAIWFHDLPKDDYHNPINVSDGLVICGRRHHNIFGILYSLEINKGDNNTQGFLTDLDRFVDREEAAIIAYNAGQINKRKKILFSEDLY